jgi:hypothetical protein
MVDLPVSGVALEVMEVERLSWPRREFLLAFTTALGQVDLPCETVWSI